MIIAIDGPAGTGKGTISKLISDRLKFMYIDTGAMYRVIALKMLRENIKLDEVDRISDLLQNTKIEFKDIENKQHTFLDGEDVSSEIRMPDVNNIVSPVSSIKIIRTKLVELQRKLAEGKNVIMEGRDITTVVFPNADLKIYLTANLDERANRRYKEQKEKGIEITYDEVYENIKKRDENDMHKEMGALKVADDAKVIDSTKMTIEEVYKEIERMVK